MAREFGLLPWHMPRLTQREYSLVTDVLNEMAGKKPTTTLQAMAKAANADG